MSSRVRARAIAGDRESGHGQTREGIRENARRSETVGARRDLFDGNREVIEDRDHEGVERFVRVLLAQVADDLVRGPATEGVELEQAVAPLLQ